MNGNPPCNQLHTSLSSRVHTSSKSFSNNIPENRYATDTTNRMIPRKPTAITLRADDIQDLLAQLEEQKTKNASAQKHGQASTSTSAEGTTQTQDQSVEMAEPPVPGGMPHTTLDDRKGKSRNERLGL
ncbi:hypothetical protein QFC21_003572 [Naganishia friedmannii]|uniref:Uncharacterized protein n=1 Tax=Naganishia friedmannii TaxID=89922 RepID=A0ACC2VNH8_9TREE|nr:hypothetical protein QFC21_003572 [Naganishia friedmannii]